MDAVDLVSFHEVRSDSVHPFLHLRSGRARVQPLDPAPVGQSKLHQALQVSRGGRIHFIQLPCERSGDRKEFRMLIHQMGGFPRDRRCTRNQVYVHPGVHLDAPRVCLSDGQGERIEGRLVLDALGSGLDPTRIIGVPPGPEPAGY